MLLINCRFKMEMTMDIFELQMKINCFKSSQNCLSKWNIVLSQRFCPHPFV